MTFNFKRVNHFEFQTIKPGGKLNIMYDKNKKGNFMIF
jgi:hypothetical protein